MYADIEHKLRSLQLMHASKKPGVESHPTIAACYDYSLEGPS